MLAQVTPPPVVGARQVTAGETRAITRKITSPPRTMTSQDCAITSRGYCEKWAVALYTRWTAPSGCPTIVKPSVDPTHFEECGLPNHVPVFLNGGYYSPGICPESYSIGCMAGPIDAQVNGEPVDENETVGFCVPTSYRCVSSNGGTYHATRSRSTALAYQIRWQSSDLINLPEHPMAGSNFDPNIETITTPELESLSTSGTSFSSGPSSQPSPSNSQPTSSPLQSAEGDAVQRPPVIIIVPVVIGTIILLALVGFFWFWKVRRRRRRREQEGEQAREATGGRIEGGDWNGQVSGPGLAELPAISKPVEKDDDSFFVRPPVEMDATQTTTPSDAPPVHSPDQSKVASDCALNTVSPLSGLRLGIGYELDDGDRGVSTGTHSVTKRESGDAWERQELIRRQSELEERRARLKELGAIEKEQAAIRRRLSAL
ncbi:hypothetical protein BN1723_013894 [Verticillium longisporum]|uniref:Uncharacterized protein n=1 Tax=Verticillium longisporum TaxID=100787 RepID=A0A0G4LXU1_VERLO|nr:hypothetical protein HYQ44_020127 [Verticillium longisporum]CRK26841.1 hypothetical protein BN1723_013894 [Verticillium longisporum]CRK27165.1 hypothetical protein BN1708_014691 [Verticillium longisporum]